MHSWRVSALAVVCLAACDTTTSVSDPNDTSPTAKLVAQGARFSAPLSGVVTGTLQSSATSRDGLAFVVVNAPAKGSLTLTDAQSGTFRYETSHASAGFDAFTFKVTQGKQVSNIAQVDISITDGGVSGTLSFDYVPTSCAQSGRCFLNYARTTAKPMRRVQVRLFAVADLVHPVAQTEADMQGRYLFPKVEATRLVVQAGAAVDSPPMVVLDNTHMNAAYVLRSDVIDTASTLLADLHAGSGWGGSGYTTTRAAGPFAIIDAALSAAEAFRVVRPNIVFAPLQVFWSVSNAPEPGDIKLGQIATSFWDGSGLYLLGDANADTDEYDTHVIVHEWGHYFETTQSRSDSPGGAHGAGDVLDMRVAFSEGWGNALGAIALYPDTVYSDVNGAGQGNGFSFDIANSDGDDSKPGWFSETSVQGIVFEVFSPPGAASKAWDTANVGLGPIYDVMTGAHRDTHALTSIFSFVQGLKVAVPAQASAIDAVVGHRGITAVADAYGTGESHDGGIGGALPVFRTLAVGANANVTMAPTPDDGSHFNKLAANRYFRAVGDGQPWTVTVRSQGPVDIAMKGPGVTGMFRRRSCTASPCTLTNMPTQQGIDYIIIVQGTANISETACNVALSH